MYTDILTNKLWLASFRVLRGWNPEHVVPIALEYPGVYRPRARA